MAPPSWKSNKDAAGNALPPEVFRLGPPVPRGELIGIVGAGGIGKTTLACLIERTQGAVGFIDLDNSLPVLWNDLQALGLSPQGVSGIKTWKQLIGALNSSVFDSVQNVVIDTGTEAQNLAIAHTLENVPTDTGAKAVSIESYGFGKGARFVHDTWLDLRYAAQCQAAVGRNMILVLHDFIAKVPNPDGADFIRWEPNLYQDNSVSLRKTTVNFLDHLFFIGYDLSADAPNTKKGEKHGKAKGTGTRTIYCSETPTCVAKSRRLSDSIPYEYGDDALWRALFEHKQPQGN